MTAATARFQTLIGNRLPGGATWNEEGTNFSVDSHVARNMELRLYERGKVLNRFR